MGNFGRRRSSLGVGLKPSSDVSVAYCEVAAAAAVAAVAAAAAAAVAAVAAGTGTAAAAADSASRCRLRRSRRRAAVTVAPRPRRRTAVDRRRATARRQRPGDLARHLTAERMCSAARSSSTTARPLDPPYSTWPRRVGSHVQTGQRSAVGAPTWSRALPPPPPPCHWCRRRRRRHAKATGLRRREQGPGTPRRLQ